MCGGTWRGDRDKDRVREGGDCSSLGRLGFSATAVTARQVYCTPLKTQGIKCILKEVYGKQGSHSKNVCTLSMRRSALDSFGCCVCFSAADGTWSVNLSSSTLHPNKKPLRKTPEIEHTHKTLRIIESQVGKDL